MSNLLYRLSDLNRKIARLKRKSDSSKLAQYKDLIYVVGINRSIMPMNYQESLNPLFELEPEEIDSLSEEKAKCYIDLLVDLEKKLDQIDNY